jgi:muramoyltetrapeptide carboxypeptidase
LVRGAARAVTKPRPLRSGDRIAVVAPASGCEREEVDRGLAEIARLGYEPVVSPALFERDLFSAGPAEVRAADFMRAWTDPSIAALVALRGGYGSVHVLPLLARADVQRTPKLLVGYSDITSMLTWLTCQCEIPALHGPMVDRRLSRGELGYDTRSLHALLQGGAGLELMPDGLCVLRPGEAAGPLFGGTLTQLTASLGTPFAFDPPEGCVLFIEDVNERPYRLDRMLTQLRLAGLLDRARALVFGEMPGCDEPGGDIRARDTVDAATRGFDGPVLYGFPSGHTVGACWTLPLGVGVRVVTSPRPGLVIEESPVG